MDPFRRMNFFGAQKPIQMGNIGRMDLGNNTPDTTTSQVDNQDDGSYGSGDVYSKLMSGPPPPAQAKYRDFLTNNVPTRDQYAPSKMTKLSAMLAGMSEGVRHGAGSANAIQQSILDSGYNDATADYKMQGDRLKGAADLEERDMLNRVKTYRDVLGDQANLRKSEKDNKLADAQIEDINSKIETRGRGNVHYTTDAQGNAIGFRMGVGGVPEKLDLGVKTGQSTADKLQFNKDNAANISNVRLPNELKVARERGDQARQTQTAKFNNIKELIDYKKTQPNNQIESLSDGSLVIVNKTDNTVSYTGFNSGKLGDKEKAALGLKNAKELKQTPGVGSTTETTLSPDGKKATKVVIPTGGNAKVKVIAPDGTSGTLDASELEEALKHGYKKAS